MIGSASSPSAIPILLRALYDAVATVTGMVGLTPIQVCEIGAALIGALFLWNLGKSITKKQGWTLDPAQTPGVYVLLEDREDEQE